MQWGEEGLVSRDHRGKQPFTAGRVSPAMQLRQPAYTGANRCWPCTGTNVVIAAVLSVAVGWLWVPAGALLFLASLAAIWLRGYLVPGTPALTKRYFPDWLLAAFDKTPTPVSDEGAIDAERVLLDAGVLEPCPEVDDLCLAPAFREAWYDHMASLRGSETQASALAAELGLDAEAVSFVEHGDAVVAHHGDGRVGQWESRAALVADLAAARELATWVRGWDGLSVAQRSQLLGGLRVFVEECPACGGPVTLAQETVESCCRSHEVVAVACASCAARLLEVPAEAA
jgi:hypothetical protein